MLKKILLLKSFMFLTNLISKCYIFKFSWVTKINWAL